MEPFIAPAKILLFGEYSVLLGSNALLTPYSKYSGQLKITDTLGFQQENISQSTEELIKLDSYLKKLDEQNKLLIPIDFDNFQNDIDKGLYFDSNIPLQYGLGSSGALTAAIFRRYSQKLVTNYSELKSNLAQIESYFHGKSSGIDSLVSYLQRPILIEGTDIMPIDFSFKEMSKKFGVFLVDSNQASATKNSVNDFMNQFMTNDEFKGILLNHYNPLLNNIIDLFLKKDTPEFYALLKQFTQYQLKLLGHLFTKKLFQIAVQGLDSDLFYLKLCGSGNGGYYLGFTKEIEETEKFFKSYGFQIILL